MTEKRRSVGEKGPNLSQEQNGIQDVLDPLVDVACNVPTFTAYFAEIIDLLMEDFEGVLNTTKWAKIAKCSQDTALRDIQDLIEKGILVKNAGGGRSTNYEMKPGAVE